MSRRGYRLRGIQPQREARGSESASTRSTKPIDDDTCPGQLVVDTEMRESLAPPPANTKPRDRPAILRARAPMPSSSAG